MNVLDVDLDFFLTDVCELADLGARPPKDACEPLPEREVRAFFEENCGLSRKNPIPGRIFDTHDLALDFWAELISDQKLTAPFSVAHIDAHSDLAIGRPGPNFIIDNVTALRPEIRADIAKYRDMLKLDEGNYLLFAVAFRWISRLANVRNPKSRPDIPQRILDENGDIRLKSAAAALIPALDWHEKRVKFDAFSDYRAYRAAGGFAFASLARSPRYAPESADFIADIFADYITPV